MPEFLPFTSAYIPAAQRLWDELAEIETTIGDTREALTRFLDRNPGCSWVAVDDQNKLIATILCGCDGRRGFIYHLAVSIHCRNAGIAQELLERAINQLQTEGISRCLIFVKQSNLPAHNFWLKNGWQFRADLAVFSTDF